MLGRPASPAFSPRAAVLAVVALASVAAGCGSSNPAPRAAAVPVPPADTTPVTTTPPPDTTSTPTDTTTTPTDTTTTPTDTTTTPTNTTTTPTTTTSTDTTPLPVAAGGLRAATGYGSYDDCTGTCTGSVPAALRRPLLLPALNPDGSCPVSPTATAPSFEGPALGTGPVYAGQTSALPLTSFVDSDWAGGRVTWVAAASYTGPVLVRGGQVGGTGAVGFGEGNVPVDELQLLTPSESSDGVREWPSFTRVQAPGCFAYQVDGTDFSEVVVFRATG